MIKSLHLLGVCLLIGNLLVSGLWKILADRTGSVPVARFALRTTERTDGLCTGIGAMLIIATGHCMAPGWGGVARPWIATSYALLIASFAVWLTVLVPIQRRQMRLLRDLPADAPLPPGFRRLTVWWAVAAAASALIPLPALWLMNAKPS